MKNLVQQIITSALPIAQEDLRNYQKDWTVALESSYDDGKKSGFTGNVLVFIPAGVDVTAKRQVITARPNGVRIKYRWKDLQAAGIEVGS